MKYLLLLLTFSTTVAFAQTNITDDFEDYQIGSFDQQFDEEWSGWSGQYSNAVISNEYAYEGSQSLEVAQQGISTTDIVHKIETLSEGQKVLIFMQYIPSEGSGAYYNLQNSYSDGSKNWAAEVRTNATTNSAFIQTAASQYRFEPIFDHWIEQKFIFNFDKNEGQFFYNKKLIHTWNLSLDAIGQDVEPAINAINFFALESRQSERRSIAYYDNITVIENISDDSFLMPVMVDEPTSLNDYIVIAPNPTSAITQLKLDFPNIQNLEVRIYDQKGQLLQTLNDKNIQSNQYALDLSEYTNGVYFCQIQTNDDMVTKRIVVNR